MIFGIVPINVLEITGQKRGVDNIADLTTPLKAIRAKCLDCVCFQREEVRLCPSEDCPLHPFRFGKNPFRKKTLTDEQKQQYAERMKKINKENNNE